MGTMYYPHFRELMRKKPNVYWVNPNDYALDQLKEIGVDKRNIIIK